MAEDLYTQNVAGQLMPKAGSKNSNCLIRFHDLLENFSELNVMGSVLIDVSVTSGQNQHIIN